MKLRLTQTGFETYTGQMGVIFFEGGLSTTDVSVVDSTRMAAIMNCEWDDGSTASVTQRILDEANTPAPVFTAEAAPEAEPEPEIAPEVEEQKFWTREDLEAVADDYGISGLRSIGDELEVKNTSIKGLIDEILEKNPK